jgi:hypothetical protein
VGVSLGAGVWVGIRVCVFVTDGVGEGVVNGEIGVSVRVGFGEEGCSVAINGGTSNVGSRVGTDVVRLQTI